MFKKSICALLFLYFLFTASRRNNMCMLASWHNVPRCENKTQIVIVHLTNFQFFKTAMKAHVMFILFFYFCWTRINLATL